MSKNTITIEIYRGILWNVKGLPEDWDYILIDYDAKIDNGELVQID